MTTFYVKDSEMPVSCNECPCFDDTTDFPNAFCKIKNELLDFNEDGERLTLCPLRPLSEALLKAGAILPKFTVGQEVWRVFRGEIFNSKVVSIYWNYEGENHLILADKTSWLEQNLYATEAEARQALDKQREDE